MPSKATTIKLLTNVAATIRLEQVYYNHSEEAKKQGWKPQLCLAGTMDGAKVRVYVPLSVGKDLTDNGWLSKDGKDKDGNPAFKVSGQPMVTLLRSEEGTKKFTSAYPADQQPQAPKTAVEAPSRPLERFYPPAPDKSAGWEFLGLRYAEALKQAVLAFKAIGREADNDALHHAAATMFIESNRRDI